VHLTAKKEGAYVVQRNGCGHCTEVVLIAFDFSEASQKPLHHALAIARHYGAKFYLAHVVSGIGYTIAGTGSLEFSREKTRRTAQQLEQELLQSGALAGLRHEFIILEGNIWDNWNFSSGKSRWTWWS